MPNQIQCTSATGRTVYALIRQIDDGTKIWSNVAGAFVTYAGGSYANYVVSMAEQGVTGFYYASFAAGVPAGNYSVVALWRTGGSPAASDMAVATGVVANNVSVSVTQFSDGANCEFLLDTPIVMGEATTLELSPFDGTPPDTTGWTFTAYIANDPGFVTPLVTVTGPSDTLSVSAGVFTFLLKPFRTDPSQTNGMHDGTLWLGLWRTNIGFEQCLMAGPVRVVKRPGLP